MLYIKINYLKTTQQILFEYGISIKQEQSDDYITLCPFHDDNNPSFSIRKDNGLYHCWSCQAKGNLITFIERIENISRDEAKEKLYGKGNVKKPDFFKNTFIKIEEKEDKNDIKVRQKYYEIKHLLDLMFNPAELRNRILKLQLYQYEENLKGWINLVDKLSSNLYNDDLIYKFNQIETYYRGEEYEKLIVIINKYNLKEEFTTILNLLNSIKYRKIKKENEKQNELRGIAYKFYKENHKTFNNKIADWIS